MGFATEAEHQRFLELCPEVEKYIVDGGITLIKIWLEVGILLYPILQTAELYLQLVQLLLIGLALHFASDRLLLRHGRLVLSGDGR
jgi:hypothetical protein